MNKRSWKEHLQKHFEKQKKENYNRLQKLSKNKIVICFDLRCALFFDSTRDFRFHCQNVHCVDRVKETMTKKRRCTFRSKMNVILDLYPNLESKHDYVFKKKLPFKCVSKITNTFTFEFIDLVYSIELIESNEQNDDVRNLINFEHFANFKFFETNWHFRNINVDVDTSTSFVIFDFFVDSKFRDNLISIVFSTQ